jgi:DNA polymerase-3 subunit gamma/tau
MSPQVFYQKWRPQTLAEVVGQQHITQTLSNALATDRVAHAYLFCGPRGTGKTSTGRVLAKAVNCLENGKGEPCNTCQICIGINEGRNLDLIEIDAASHTGVDDIRKLRENVNYSPDLARFKVYIIDEVHMLSDSAFNALLKTLEEPPPHVIFVLATTEIHKIPPTILSRCQRFDFRRISLGDIIGRLEGICQSEGIEADGQALGLIGKAATGSLRDAENLLERLTISHSSKITMENAQELLGITGDERASQMVKYILTKDVTAGITTINAVAGEGLDMRQFTKEIVEYLRGTLMIKVGSVKTLDLDKSTIEEMKQIANQSSAEEILEAIKLFGKVNLRPETQSTIPIELAIVEFSLPKAVPVKVARPTNKPEPSAKKSQAPKPVKPKQTQPKAETTTQSTSKPVETTPPVEATTESKTISAKEPIKTTPIIEPTAKEETPIHKAQPIPDDATTIPLSERNLAFFQQHWKSVVQNLKGVGSTGNLDALLRSACDPIALEDNTIVLGFYYPFHKEKIEDPKYQRFVEQAISKVFGAEYKVRCELTPREQKKQKLLDVALGMGAEIISDEQGGNQ